MSRLGVADEVLDDALRLRVGRMAEVGTEPVVGGEADVVRCRDHHVGHDPTFEAAHPVSEHLGRGTADRLEALGQHRHRRRRGLVAGEAHEPEPAPRHHRAEHLDPAGQGAPVDHHRLARRPHRRAALTTVRRPPRLLLLGDEPPEVPWRPRVAGRPRRRQQPLRRDPRPRPGDSAATSIAYAVGVLRHRRPPGALLVELACAHAR